MSSKYDQLSQEERRVVNECIGYFFDKYPPAQYRKGESRQLRKATLGLWEAFARCIHAARKDDLKRRAFAVKAGAAADTIANVRAGGERGAVL